MDSPSINRKQKLALFEVTYVGVDENGKIKLDELEAAIRPDTILIDRKSVV